MLNKKLPLTMAKTSMPSKSWSRRLAETVTGKQEKERRMIKTIKMKEAIIQLENRGFQKSVDTISEYSPNADLYYRQIDENRFIIFNHYNKKKKEMLQGFDCWISEYKSASEIGKKKALKTEDVKLTFDFQNDWQLLSSYI